MRAAHSGLNLSRATISMGLKKSQTGPPITSNLEKIITAVRKIKTLESLEKNSMQRL